MLTKSRLSLLRTLRQKKFRKENGLFVAEGDKLVLEILNSSFSVETLYATNEWLKENRNLASQAPETIAVSKDELSKISTLITPQNVLAVVSIPEFLLEEKELVKKYSLVLDGIRDPGNMGTIIRIADWFGIRDIICSPDCAEVWNPKVVQASMGSLLRVRIYEKEAHQFIEDLNKATRQEELSDPMIYGTFLDGENVYTTQFNSTGVIVIGNESNGISLKTAQLVNKRITIPLFRETGDDSNRPESLNAAIATAIVCAELRRTTSN